MTNNRNIPSHRSLLAFVAAALLTTGLAAQLPVVQLKGDIHDKSVGVLKKGAVYWIVGNSRVPSGTTLTAQPGAIIKMDRNALSVQGRLLAQGVVFTSIKDDRFGGDSNRDGGSTKGAKGDWVNLELVGNGTGVLDNCRFYFGGSSGATILIRNTLGFDMKNLLIEKSAGPGIAAGTSNSKLVKSEIRDCDGRAVDNWAYQHVENLADNKASGNKGDYVQLRRRINTPWPTQTITMKRTQTMNNNGVHVLTVVPSLVLAIPNGNTLAIGPGNILKFTNSSVVTVWGTLKVQGTRTSPVYLTSFHDDVGGDTNQSTQKAAAGDWGGVSFLKGSSASVIENATFSFAGTSQKGCVHISEAAPVFRGCRFSRSTQEGVQVIPNVGAVPAFENCQFRNNNTYAVNGLSWLSVARSFGCVASGNKSGDFFRVQGRLFLSGTMDIHPRNYPGNVVVHFGTSNFSGGTLRFHRGCIIKNAPSSAINSAHMDALGTSQEPVVFTALADDTVGGDTNKDGSATRPTPGSWKGLTLTGTGDLQHTRIRYPGGSGHRGIQVRNVGASLTCVRVDYSGGIGVEVWGGHNGPLNNLVVLDAKEDGLRLVRGGFDVNHATITGCGGYGIYDTGSWTGNVNNSISWRNSKSNFAGLNDKRVRSCNGQFAGKNGNIDQDPKFINASAGDLHLATGSPCLGTADMSVAMTVKKDHDEFSRILDHALNGQALPDMGAYELHVFELEGTGQPVLGGKMSFKTTGPAGNQLLFLGPLNGEVFVPPFGFALLGSSLFFLLDAGAVGKSTTICIPNSQALLGATAGLQGVGDSKARRPFGGVTNLWRITIRKP